MAKEGPSKIFDRYENCIVKLNVPVPVRSNMYQQKGTKIKFIYLQIVDNNIITITIYNIYYMRAQIEALRHNRTSICTYNIYICST